MIDWLFALLILMAFIMIILSVVFRGLDPYWNILLIVISTALWFFLALMTTGGLETAYSAYNATTGATTLEYGLYAPADFIFLSYFFLLMAILGIIYLIVTIFGYYYEKLDEKMRQQEEEMQD
jgi:hypothetical protein